MVYITPCVLEYQDLSPAIFAITPELIQQFIHHVNEFNETFTLLDHHLNYLQGFVVHETNVIYTEQHPDVWIEDISTSPTFGSTTTFVLNYQEHNNFMFMKIIPKWPDEDKPLKYHDLMRIYLHELRKCDQFRRRLRMVLGDMQTLEAKYFNHIVNAGIKNRPDIRYCIAKMHVCGRKWLWMRRKFHRIAKLKHFYLEPGTVEVNDYQIEPVLHVVKRSINLLKD